jgi:hypothetical protein
MINGQSLRSVNSLLRSYGPRIRPCPLKPGASHNPMHDPPATWNFKGEGLGWSFCTPSSLC